jgi:hypothetical protein
MATGKRNGEDVPFPVRGVPGGWVDWFDLDPDDVVEVAAFRHQVATSEAMTQRIAAELQREERRERKRRERAIAREQT